MPELIARNVAVAVLGVLTLALVLAAVVLLSRQTDVAPITIIAPTPDAVVSPTVAPQSVRVHVAGAVAIPGVYTLHPDDRIVDAIAAAGGETLEAESSRLNLAQRVQDGARYYVPELAEEFPPDAAPGPSAAGGAPPANGLIDLNNASGAVLETLPGIGPALAGAIVSYRESNGPFQSVEELVNVPRIGPLTLGKIRLLVTVSAIR